MISRRTQLLLAIALLLLVTAGWMAHRRMVVCEARVHLGARRAPIRGASEDPADFGCKVLDPVSLSEKAIDFAWFMATLAMVRSLWLDVHLRRLSRLSEEQQTDRD